MYKITINHDNGDKQGAKCLKRKSNHCFTFLSTNSKHHFLLPHIMVRTFSPQYLLIRSEERMSVTTLICGVICFICDVTSHFPPPETARFRDYGVTNWHNRQLGVRQGLLVLQAQFFISWQLWNKKTPRAEICNGVPLQPNDASLLNRCRWTIVGFRTACLGHRQNRLLSWNWKPNSLRGSWVYMGGISIKGNDIYSLKELLRYGWKRGSLISIKRLTMT